MSTTSLLDSNVKLLGRLPLFADVPKDDLMQLAGQTRLDSYAALIRSSFTRGISASGFTWCAAAG